VKLTVKATASLKLPPGKKDCIAWDDDVPGFGIRLREGGARNWVYQYKLGKQQRRITFGSVTAMSIADARRQAEQFHAQVKLGRDPAGDKVDAKIKAAETFEATAARYLEYKRTRLRPRSYSQVERHVLKHAKALHGLQLAKIERRDIATAIAAVADDAGMVTGNRVRATLSAMFTWALMHGLAETNPVIGTMRNKERSRERVLTPAELRLIGNHLGDDHDHYAAIIRLLALTGCRASEIADMRWSELRDGTLVLPSERTKNARVHIVPLSAPARAIIEAQARRVNADGRPRDLIFGTAQGGFSGWGICKDRLNKRIANATGKPLEHWTPHDIRRTVATGMADLGTSPHVIECVLNHVGGFRAGVHGVYNRNSYAREMTAALDLWAEHLMAIVEGREATVVPLHRQA
jgi:integrase